MIKQILLASGICAAGLVDIAVGQPIQSGVDPEMLKCSFQVKNIDFGNLDLDYFRRFSNRCTLYLWEAGNSKYGFIQERERWWEAQVARYRKAATTQAAYLWCSKAKLCKYPSPDCTGKNLLKEVGQSSVRRWKIRSNAYELIDVDGALMWVNESCLAFPVAGLPLDTTIAAIKALRLSFEYVNGDNYLPICHAEKTPDGKKWQLKTACTGNGVEYSAGNNPETWHWAECSIDFKDCKIGHKEHNTEPRPDGEPGV